MVVRGEDGAAKLVRSGRGLRTFSGGFEPPRNVVQELLHTVSCSPSWGAGVLGAGISRMANSCGAGASHSEVAGIGGFGLSKLNTTRQTHIQPARSKVFPGDLA